MKKILKVSVFLVSIFIASCSNDDSFLNISNSNLSGTVSGDSFTAVGGKAFDSGDEVSINITNITANCNSSVLDYDLYISTSVPLEKGTYKNTNVVFQKDGETPLNFTNGTVEVVDVTTNTITVKIKASAGSEDTIEGRFAVEYCN